MLYDVIVIGGGIVGTAAARAILQKKDVRLLLIESEKNYAKHQTGNNSGVIHSGLYYKPGSLKALNCKRGRELLYAYCQEKSIAHDRCGKLVVATKESEVPVLDELERRGNANGLDGMKRLKKEEIASYEPHAAGIDALFVQQTGIVDYTAVTESFVKDIQALGGETKTDCTFLSVIGKENMLIVKTTQGEFNARFLINCGGLYSDRIAAACGVKSDITIIPFRGEYFTLIPEKKYLVKNLIYPVPDPRFPFLGVHFTRMIDGGVEAGPNAVLAFKREGYSYSAVSLRDIFVFLTFPGFYKMARKYYAMGFKEMYRSLRKKAFTKALQELVPEITGSDIIRGGAGVRAQALHRNGSLLDDFCIEETKTMIHVLNAPSPAATASLSIGETIAERYFARS